MAKMIDKIRFFECGKPAPKGSRFQGNVSASTLFGEHGYFDYTTREDANEPVSITNRTTNKGFIGYTQREEAANGYTMTSSGFLKTPEQENRFIKEGLKYFCSPGDLAWEVIISFDSYDEMKQVGFENQQDYALAIQKILPQFFQKVGLDPSNIFWWENYHSNKNNPHMHVVFMEKQKTRTRGSFTQKQLDYLKSAIVKEVIARKSLEVSTGMDSHLFMKKKDEMFSQIIDAAKQKNYSGMESLNDFLKTLPKTGRLQYNSKSMDLYRPQLDNFINKIIESEECKPIYERLVNSLDQLDRTMNEAGQSDIGAFKTTELGHLYEQIGNLILKEYKKDHLQLGEEAEPMEELMANIPKEPEINPEVKSNISKAMNGDIESLYRLGSHFIRNGNNGFKNRLESRNVGEELILNAALRGHQKAQISYARFQDKYQSHVIDRLIKRSSRLMARRAAEIEREIEAYLYGRSETHSL